VPRLNQPTDEHGSGQSSRECISTDSFKEKLTLIKEVNQAKPKQVPLHSRSEYINKAGDEFNM
jgi:hypothetical protein